MLDKSISAAGVKVYYKVMLPTGFDPAKEYPAIVVMGGGPQTMATVDSAFNRNFRLEAEKRGYIVVGPAAPAGELFFRERRAHLPRVPRRKSSATTGSTTASST